MRWRIAKAHGNGGQFVASRSEKSRVGANYAILLAMDSRTSRPPNRSPQPSPRDPFENVPFGRAPYGESAAGAEANSGFPNGAAVYDAEFASAYDIEGEAVRPRGEARRGGRRWLEALLLLGFVLCLLVGLGALATLYLLNREVASSYRAAPLAAIQSDEVAPQLALRELTFFGGAAQQTQSLAYQLVNAGYGESALATATFDTRTGNLTPGAATDEALAPSDTRASLLLRLGRYSAQVGNPARARELFTLARDLVLLDNRLPAIQRVQLLTTAAEGLRAADGDLAALDTAQQAYDIAAHWPDLLPAQRVQMLDALRPVVQQLVAESSVRNTADRLDAQIGDLTRNPYLDPAGTFAPPLWNPRGEALSLGDDVLLARNARQAAASALVARLEQLIDAGIDIRKRRPDDYEVELVALGQALLAEDEARAAAYQRVADDGATLAEQLWLLQTQRAWQAQKLKIARGAYGLSIVPQWEAQIAALSAELGALTDGLRPVMEAQLAAAPAEEQAQLRVEMLRWLLGQSLLGLYPGASPAALGAELVAAQETLEQPPVLFLEFNGDSEDRGDPRIFIRPEGES